MDNEELQGHTGEETSMPDITYRPGYNKLDSFNWLNETPDCSYEDEIVEIRFKNTRKGFYRNVNNLRLEIGDVVAVEASPGHDIGRVSMTGRLIREQIRKFKSFPSPEDIKKVYRKAKAVDVQKWEEAKKLETPTMLRSRKISEELKLNM
jgi:cell fate regulator YaaT (PSP1 superfamily)